MMQRNRTPSALSPAARITATISSTVGGPGGYRRPLFLGESPSWSWTWSQATYVYRRNPAAALTPSRPPLDDERVPRHRPAPDRGE
jgi:hypothetical protein